MRTACRDECVNREERRLLRSAITKRTRHRCCVQVERDESPLSLTSKVSSPCSWIAVASGGAFNAMILAAREQLPAKQQERLREEQLQLTRTDVEEGTPMRSALVAQG